jgi:S-adenosylmethionine decarboxylase
MTPTGTHLIVDFRGCTRLDDPQHIERVLRAAVEAAGATLLGLHLHHFGPHLGVTGVALLAESHLSIHTWPETGYAAIDIFLCGPGKGLDEAFATLKAMMTPGSATVRRLIRD